MGVKQIVRKYLLGSSVTTFLLSYVTQNTPTKSHLFQEQKLVWHKRTIDTKEPILFGHVYVTYSKNKLQPLAYAAVVLDGKISFTDEAGNYIINIKAGRHKLQAGTIGILNSLVSIRTKQGDSLQIDFCLRPDPRPLY